MGHTTLKSIKQTMAKLERQITAYEYRKSEEVIKSEKRNLPLVRLGEIVQSVFPEKEGWELRELLEEFKQRMNKEPFEYKTILED